MSVRIIPLIYKIPLDIDMSMVSNLNFNGYCIYGFLKK
ncbi:hypothetical protein C1G86_1422 [Dehalococcoides mccartyi]|uniref:Uncharacterized protein n=1 Tax=Dehalococcoides mccartyi TaxID=61435 RepID=A0A328EN34_9CHLR|nr:hypothetical protein C1G87_1384 [Dehalococcoides mccartyi]RAL70098.1 hypothetical protein C1G86_1422 [Dehalococcoides mccartyi]